MRFTCVYFTHLCSVCNPIQPQFFSSFFFKSSVQFIPFLCSFLSLRDKHTDLRLLACHLLHLGPPAPLTMTWPSIDPVKTNLFQGTDWQWGDLNQSDGPSSSPTTRSHMMLFFPSLVSTWPLRGLFQLLRLWLNAFAIKHQRLPTLIELVTSKLAQTQPVFCHIVPWTHPLGSLPEGCALTVFQPYCWAGLQPYCLPAPCFVLAYGLSVLALSFATYLVRQMFSTISS